MELITFQSGCISIACTSDTHNDVGTHKIPEADLFLHAGDMTNEGTYEELEAAYNWISTLSHKVKIIVAGNNDLGLDPKHPSYSAKSHSLFTSPAAERAGVHYLDRETRVVARFRSSDGSIKPLSVYGNPCQPMFFNFSNPNCSFTYVRHPDPSASDAWNTAPIEHGQSGVNIWLMHSPPRGRLDTTPNPLLTGCEVEARCIAKARPLVAVFGHYHSDYGLEKVTWDHTEDKVVLSEIISRDSEGKEFDFSNPDSLDKDLNTLFVNAAWMTSDKARTEKRNTPWLIKINFDEQK